jgi:tetrahydromethanopterin S-methyltransferase subunit G
MTKNKPEFDGPWKDILDIYFEQFIAYCWPSKYHEIDWRKGYKMREKELTKVTRQSEAGKKVADKLVEIHLKNGTNACIFLHIEVEKSSKSNLPKRMFIYNTRFRDLFNMPIASIVILIDSCKNWRPNHYKEELWGTTVEITFPIIKILDYQDRIPELEVSLNPFAAVILAQLAVMKKEDPSAKLNTKIELSKRLYAKRWEKQDLFALFKFIDWVIALPQELELEYTQTIEKIEEEFKMTYVSTAERVGLRKGEEVGIEKGKVLGESEMLVYQLSFKFQTVPQKYLDKIKNAHADALMAWARKLLFAPKIEDVFEDENTLVVS